MSGRFEIQPARFPVFYGWVILVVGGVGVLMSAPGQTFGVAPFTEPLLEHLGMDRDRLSLAYMLGTIASSLVLTYAGRAYDRFGARIVATAACITLGLVLGVLSQCDRIAAFLGRGARPETAAWISFAVIVACFFLLRFSGQGVLTLVSNNMMMKWFDRHRGLVTGISGMVIAPFFSAAPMLFNAFVQALGWRGAWILLGVAVGVGYALVAWAFYRDNPEAYGLRPDGPLADRGLGSRRTPGPVPHPYTLAEARRTFAFWLFALGVGLFGMYITGLSFHVASIFEEAGLDAQSGFSIFLPGAVVAILFKPLAGWFADRYPLKYLLMILMVSVCLSCAGFMRLGSPFALWLLIGGNGLAGSVFSSLVAVTWPNFFGRRHLGAVSGLNMSVMVFLSAIGPWLFSQCLSQTGSYRAVGGGVAVVAGALCLAAFRGDSPQSRIRQG